MADGSVIIDSKLDSSGFEKGLKSLGSVASKGLSATTKAIGAVSTGLATAAGFAIKAGIDFESAFTGVKKTVDATDEQLQQLKSSIREMSTEMPQTASEIAEVAEAAGQLGISVDNIEGFTKTMVQLGDATNLTSEEAATSLARLANITGMPQENFDRLGSSIVALGNNLATTESEITEMSLRLAGAGAQIGLTEAEITGFAGALSSVGIEAEAGGSAFSKVMVDMQLAVESGGESLGNFANVAGMSTTEFQKAFKDDAAGAIMSFINGLASCEERGVSAIKTLDDMGISEIRLRDALLRASGASDTFNKAIDLSSEAWEENIALSKEAETRYATMESQIEILKNKLTDLGISFYEDVRNPLVDVVEEANNMIDQLSNAFETGGLDGLASAIGDVFAQITVNLANVAPEMINAATTVIQSFIQGISDNLPQIISSAGEIVSSLVNGIIVIIPQLVTLGGQILSELAKGIISNTSSVSKSATEIITKFINGLTENLPEIIKTGTEVIKSLSDGIAESLPEIIPVAIEAIIQFAESILDNLDTIVDCALEIIVSLAEGLINALPTLIEKAPIIVEKLVDGIIKAIPKIIEAVGEIIDSLLKALINNSPKIIEGAYKIIGKLAEGLIKGIHLVIEGTKKIIDKITTTITTTDWIEVGKNVIQGFINGITSMVSNVGSAIKGVCDSAIKSAKSALGIHSPSKVFKEEVGQFIGQGMAKGIEESTPEASKATIEMCNSVLANGKAFLEKQKAQDKAWSDSKKEQYAAQKQALYDYIQKKKELNQLKLEDEKYIYQQLLKAAKGNQKEIEEINKKIVEADEEAYQKRYANSKQWIADKKYFNQMSLQDELAAYERMKDYSKGHAEETKEIEKEIYRVKKEIVAKEVQDVKDANAKILDELKDRVDKEKQIINGKRDSALDSLQSQLDAIDKAEEERQNNMTIADYENELIKYREALANASDPEEQQRINEQIYEKQKAYDEWKYQQELKAKKEAIRAQMDEVRAQAEEQIAVKEDEYEKEKTMLEKQQEAMIKAIENGQAEMVKAIKEGGAQSLNIQDANAIRAMGINKSLTKDKQENLDKQYQAVIDNENKSAKAVEDACVEMYRQNYRMGEQMVNGIADGILNRTWRAVKAMSMMCDKVTNEAKKKLDIHSPSRVFKRLGQYVDQGFENGITGYSDSVISSMSGMCDRLKNVVNVDDLVGRMSSAVNGQIAVTSNLMTSGLAGITTNNTTTNNNTSNTPITINVYGNDMEDDKYGRNLASQIKRELRGRGLR